MKQKNFPIKIWNVPGGLSQCPTVCATPKNVRIYLIKRQQRRKERDIKSEKWDDVVYGSPLIQVDKS